MSAASTDPVVPLTAPHTDHLARDGFVMLRGAVSHDWIPTLCRLFDDSVVASNAWPVPRGADWQHAQLDHDPLIQRLCRLPVLLRGAAQIIGKPFFLAQVEGRAPRRHNQAQMLHRDADGATAQVASAFVYLDPFGPDNGATQVVPRSHTMAATANTPLITSGEAGDILLIDPRLLHGATTNHTGAARRTLLISYTDTTLGPEYDRTAQLRGVRMGASEVFSAGFTPAHQHDGSSHAVAKR